MRSLFTDYVRLLRLHGWGFLSMPPIFGALSIGITSIQDIALLFLLGTLSGIYGFVLNDYVDIEIDKLSKYVSERPLAKGTISKKTALFICVLCVIGVLLIIFAAFYKNQPSFYIAVLCILLSAILGSTYDLFGKRIVGSDFLVGLSEALLVPLGALMVLRDGGTLSLFTWVIFILTFNSVLYLNAVVGGLKDADHDYLMNVKNVALTSGVKVTDDNKMIIPTGFKAFGLGIRFFSAFLVFVPFAFCGEDHTIGQILLLMLLIVGEIYQSTKLLNIKKFDKDEIRKLVVLQSFFRYPLVPIMLALVIGPLHAFILATFPFMWFFLFLPLFSPQKTT